MEKQRIYMGADHAGWELKEALKRALVEEGHDVLDFSNAEMVPDDDYPDIVRPVAERVVEDPGSFGIVACASGQGSCMAANKVAGVRAGLGYDETSARVMRQDNDANMLCLAGRVLTKDKALEIAHAFLETPFSDAERHMRRINKLV